MNKFQIFRNLPLTECDASSLHLTIFYFNFNGSHYNYEFIERHD